MHDDKAYSRAGYPPFCTSRKAMATFDRDHAAAGSQKQYECTHCGWKGTVSEMDADCVINTDVWSNHICPECGEWQELGDYEEIGEAVTA